MTEEQRRAAEVASAYAEWVVTGLDRGYITRPARHDDLFAQWLAWAQGRQS